MNSAMGLVTYDLGEVGLRWVRQVVSHSVLPIGKCLALLPIEGGRVWTRVPDHLARDEAVRRLPSGMLEPWGDADYHWEDEVLADYLAGHPSRCVVAPSQLRLSWPAVEELRVPFFLHEGEIDMHLFLAGPRRPERRALRDLEEYGLLYPFIALLTSLPDEHPPLRHSEWVGAEVIALLAARTEFVVLGAYDEENDVIWERPAAQRPTLRA